MKKTVPVLAEVHHVRFITRLFALIGFIVTLAIVVGIGVGYWEQKQETTEPDSVVLTMDFDDAISEQTSARSPIDLALGSDEGTSLLDILRAIDRAKEDPHVKAIVARFGSTEPTFAQVQEITAAIKRFRATNKMTYAFGSSYGDFGLGNRTYYLASAFESIWLQPVGAVSLTGLALYSPFAKTAFDRIGVKADFMQREEYKSFMDMATRDGFAPPVRENMQGVVDSLADQEATGIGENRKWDADHVRDLMAKGPYTDDEAKAAGLVDHLGYTDQIDKELEDKYGKGIKTVDIDSYLSFDPIDKKEPKAKIALIYGSGLITDKDSGGVDTLTGEHALGADTLVDAFDSAGEDKDVKAILFRIDSPGGSPSASETIRRAMMHAQAAGKPVFVSMGDMAASGGYWIAMNADTIVADPGTLTGSIGVLGGKFTDNGLLQKLGVSVDSIRSGGDNGGMWLPTGEFTPAQRARVNALLDNSYHTFISDVSTARNIPMEKMGDVAKGRVWTGEQAKKIGLVDALGGYQTTLMLIRAKLDLGEHDPVLLQPYPAPQSPMARVQKLLKTLGVEASLVGVALNQWNTLSARLAPYLGAATTRPSPVSARLPDAFVHELHH